MYVPSNPLYTSVVTLSEFTLLILQFIDHVTHVVNPFSAPWYIQTIIYFFGGFFLFVLEYQFEANHPY